MTARIARLAPPPPQWSRTVGAREKMRAAFIRTPMSCARLGPDSSEPEGRRPKAGGGAVGRVDGASATEMAQRLAAVHGVVGNRARGVRGRESVRADVHNAGTLHSHVRLFTRGAVRAIGRRQGCRD